MSQINLTPEELSDLIGLVYDSVFEEVQWQSLLTRICAYYPGVGGVAFGMDGDTIVPAFAKSGVKREFLSQDFRVDLKTKSGMTCTEATARTPNGFVSRTKVFFDRDEYLQSSVYQDHLRPAGFRQMLQMKVDHNGDRSALVTFATPKDPDLEEKLHDPLFETLKLLAPHAVRASQLARALALAKKSTEVFSGFLDGIILPMLVTDVQGKYLFGNAAGRRVLERGDPFTQARDGRLKLANEYDTADLVHQLVQTDRDLVQSGLRVETEETPLMLAISPFRPSMRDASAIDRHLLDDERMFAIFVGQSEQDAINPALLEDVFDLTKREAEVCKNLLAGESVAAIAEGSDRSPKTVRNQIQMIYEKIGVSSNTELMDTLSIFRTVGTMFDSQSNGFTEGTKMRMLGV
ncbi:MAG: LuxR C-terminal-related transcriptional regulator [Pseudomonadota bacterium]